MLPALDVLKEYLGIIFTYPDVVQIYKGGSSKVKDCDKMKEEGRIDVSGVFQFMKPRLLQNTYYISVALQQNAARIDFFDREHFDINLCR